jgi:hypothetical protein
MIRNKVNAVAILCRLGGVVIQCGMRDGYQFEVVRIGRRVCSFYTEARSRPSSVRYCWTLQDIDENGFPGNILCKSGASLRELIFWMLGVRPDIGYVGFDSRRCGRPGGGGSLQCRVSQGGKVTVGLHLSPPGKGHPRDGYPVPLPMAVDYWQGVIPVDVVLDYVSDTYGLNL